MFFLLISVFIFYYTIALSNHNYSVCLINSLCLGTYFTMSYETIILSELNSSNERLVIILTLGYF